MRTVAVIGCGRFGPHLARNLAKLDVRVVVSDRHPERADAVAGALGLEAVPIDGIWTADAVAIATSADSHAPLAHRALDAGCDVLVEKPFTLNGDDADALVARAHRLNRILMVDHTPLWEPGFSTLSTHAQSERVDHAETWRIGPAPPGLSSPTEALWDLAPHDLAVLDALFGPARVFDASWTACGAVMQLQHHSGVTSRVEVGWAPERTRRVRLVGRTTCVVEPPATLPDPEPLAGVARAFVEAIQTRSTPRSDGELGARVVGLVESAAHRFAAP